MKIELELPDKPEVHYIGGVLSMDPATVVGHLIKAWAWFDKHTENGHAYGVTHLVLDSVTGVTGFGEAMMLAGWLEQHDKTLIMPKFDRHTSESAKKRALSTKRKSRQRTAERHASSVTETGPEKRREDINIYSAARKKRALKHSLPKGFCLSEKVAAWAAAHGYGDLDAHLAYFVNQAQARGYTYADWDAALMGAIRDNWAKVKSDGTLRVAL